MGSTKRPVSAAGGGTRGCEVGWQEVEVVGQQVALDDETPVYRHVMVFPTCPRRRFRLVALASSAYAPPPGYPPPSPEHSPTPLARLQFLRALSAREANALCM